MIINLETSPGLDELQRISESLRWFGFSLITGTIPAEFARDALALRRSSFEGTVPLEYAGTAARGRAILGVHVWRLIGELQAPLHRRTNMSIWWSRALKACPKEAMAAFAEVRRQYGDFDSEAVARELFPDEAQEARMRAEQERLERIRQAGREQYLARRILRALEGAFGDKVKAGIESQMRQCDNRPNLEQLERMHKMIGAPPAPAKGRR